jgi:8-oxo-dGTP pyrophosphatase MutT (NUDIX family)
MKRYSGIMVRHKGRVLLAKRNNKGSLPGEWSVFGGSLEEGENPGEGAIREFYEETNVKATNEINLCGMIERYTRDGQRVKGMMYVFCMDSDTIIKPDLDNAKDGDEHTTWGYFDLNMLPTPLNPKLKEIIEIVLK